MSYAVALLVLCAALPIAAQETGKPDPGALHDNVFVPVFDDICARGQRMSEGCDAIRAREILDASQTPWRAIGRVNFASTSIRTHCTGTLIAEDIVLTAAHCLYNFQRKMWIPPVSIRFVAGFQRGEFAATSTAARFVLDAGQDTDSRDFRGIMANDWALIVLADPIGRETGFLPLMPLPDVAPVDQSFVLAGYSGLRPQVLSLARDCGTPEFTSGVLLQTCSAMPGDSGAPILSQRGDRIRVVGVHSGSVRHRGGLASLSVPVSLFAPIVSAETAY